MNIRLIKLNQMTTDLVEAWSEVQRHEPMFASPFFRPEFAQLVASVRGEVELAVMEEQGEAIGFWPFHRDRWNVARPIGLGLSDFHGVIVRGNVQWCPKELLRACRLRAWSFDHSLVAQREMQPSQWLVAESPLMDLSQGYEHYENERRQAGSTTISQVRRKMRKIEREVGPLRLVLHESNDALLQRLFELKVDQYRRIKSQNHLAANWKRDVLAAIAKTQSKHFSGLLSALYAGDELIALHLGMLSSGVMHCWFPVYMSEFSAYSPGLIFWLRFAQEAAAHNIRRFDLGKGDERYKQSLKSDSILIAEGSVDLRPVVRLVRHGLFNANQWLRATPLKRPAQTVVQSFRSWWVYS